MGGKDRNKEDMEYLRSILRYMPEGYASKFASVIDRARQAGVTDTREMRRLLEELHPEAVETWEDHLYSNRDPQYAGMSFEEFQRSIRGEDKESGKNDSSQADDFHADIKMDFHADIMLGFDAEPEEES